MLTSALAKGLGLLTTPIFTRLLSGENYGKYTLYMSILGLVTLVCSAFISPTVIYRGLDKFKEEKREFIFSAFVFGTGVSAVFCLFLFAFSRVLGLEAELLVVLFIQIFCDITVGLSQNIRRYNYDYRALSRINAVSVILTPLLSVILILGGIGYKGRIYALLGVSLAVAVTELYPLLIGSAGAFKKRFSSYIMKRTLPLLPNALSSAGSAELDKLMIAGFLGAGALAKYSIAHTVGLGLGFAVTAICSSLHPWVIRKLSAGSPQTVIPVFESLLIALSAAGIAVALLLPELFSFLAPAEYSDARTSALPLIISTVPAFASSFITTCLIHGERGSKTFYSAAGALLSGSLLNLLLIPSLGFLGAALSHLLSVTAAFVINYIFLKRSNIPAVFSVMPFVKTFAFSAALIAIVPAATDLRALRILLLTVPVTMLLFSYSKIRELIFEG